MRTLQPSQLLNLHLDWLTYGLSRRDRSIPGENNMSYPGNGEHSHRKTHLVDQARQYFYDAIDAKGVHVLSPNECLGNVQVIRSAEHQHQYRADALVTNQPGIVIETLFADCTPILLVDPINRAIGIVHASWQGTLHNVVGNTIAAMTKNFGSSPPELAVYMGPTICAKHYRRTHNERELGMMMNLVLKTGVLPVFHRQGVALHGDIRATNLRLLNHYDVMDVEVSSICTMEHADQPSARRDDPKLGGPFRTNGLAAIMIRP